MMMKFIFLLLTVTVHDVACADPDAAQSHFTSPAPTLTCMENGFSVAVVFGTYTTAKYSHVGTMILGADGSHLPGHLQACTQSGIATTGSAVTNVDLTLATKTTIVYAQQSVAKCGGGLTNTATTLGYKNILFIDVTETIDNARIRVYRYKYFLRCTLTRKQTEAGTPSFTVDSTLQLEEAAGSKSDSFDLGVSLNFLDDDSAVKTTDFTVDNFEMLNLRVKEDPGNADYKFTVQRCFASQDSSASATTLVDNFFDAECPADNTVTFTRGGDDQSQFDFKIRAFYMTGRATDAVYIHCELFVCRTAETISVYEGKCIQNTKTICDNSAGRKRRGVDAEEERKTVFTSTKNSFKVAVSGVRCPDGYVFDSSLDECTNQRLLLIKGVYLGLEWIPAYANVSSPAFKQFARSTGSQLEALIRNANKQNVIKGLNVVAAREGSVILDVLVTYAEDVDHVKAFQTFGDVVLKTTPQMTRIVNLLNIRQDKVIEYVQVAADNGHKTNMEMILVVVIVAVVILIAVISGITFYRVQQTRPRHAAPAPTTVPNVFDNKAMESV